MSKMNWEQLFSIKRTGDSGSKNRYFDPVRDSYQQDYDRIIFSSPFRRLQNKTQVFPLPGSVFVHNRLTHSLEVTSVGRSLGKAVGIEIWKKHEKSLSETAAEFYRYELPSVIAAACLSHDIGNPPFGHSGEDAIRNYFIELEGNPKKIIENSLSACQLKDFTNFEGNSNALRVLTHAFNSPEQGGLKLTYATLASIVKYPSDSLSGFDKKTGLISTKKSGFFDSERQTYLDIAETLGIPALNEKKTIFSRHPFVYLTEAADDICYRVIDLEDAHRLGIVSFETFLGLFLPFFNEGEEFGSQGYVLKKIAKFDDDRQKAQYIRAAWIGTMVQKMTDVFMANEEALLNGTLQKDLLDCLPENERGYIDAINKFSIKEIYNYKSVVEIECAGFNIIGGLLKEFISGLLAPTTNRSKKLLQLVSKQFIVQRRPDTLYNDIHSVVDFISGMTDLYAIDLYRKISGIAIPEIK